jgi:hypothetical protein
MRMKKSFFWNFVNICCRLEKCKTFVFFLPLTRWKNYFCQVLNVQGPGSIRQTEINTAEPFVPEPSAAEVEAAFRKLKKYKAPGCDQIPAELIQAGGGNHYVLRYINLLC